MKIYLLDQLLVQSQFYEEPMKETNRRERENRFSQLERDWSIGLWNCGDKLTLEKDDPSRTDVGIIVRLIDMRKKTFGYEFRNFNLSNPEKILDISSYHDFILTPKTKVMDIVHQLEKAEIDCIVGHNGGTPLPSEYDYASPRIREKLKKRFDVRKIVL